MSAFQFSCLLIYCTWHDAELESRARLLKQETRQTVIITERSHVYTPADTNKVTEGLKPKNISI